MSGFSKEQQAGSRKPKNPGKIPHQSKAMQVKNAEYHRVLEEIDQEREPICQGCGKPEFEHSHSLPRNYKDHAFLSDKRNIWRLCRECHVGYENGYVWPLKCGKKLMQNIWKLDLQYYSQKVMQVAKRLDAYKKANWLAISQKSIIIPDWIEELVSDIQFD